MTITCLPKEPSYSKKDNNNSPYCIKILMPDMVINTIYFH